MNKKLRIGMIIGITLLVLLGTYFGLNSLSILDAGKGTYEFPELKCNDVQDCKEKFVNEGYGSSIELNEALNNGVKIKCDNFCKVVI